MTFSKDIFLDDKQNGAMTNSEEFQAQRNINARLDGMSVRNITGTQYDSMSHRADVLYVVTRDSNTIELYKGDMPISGTGKLTVDHAVVFNTNSYDAGGIYWLNNSAHPRLDESSGGDLPDAIIPPNIAARDGGIVTRFIFSDPHNYGTQLSWAFQGGLCVLFNRTKSHFTPSAYRGMRLPEDYFYARISEISSTGNGERAIDHLRPYVRLYVSRNNYDEILEYKIVTAMGQMQTGVPNTTITGRASAGTTCVLCRTVDPNTNDSSSWIPFYPLPNLNPEIMYQSRISARAGYGRDTTWTPGTSTSIPTADRSGAGGLTIATDGIENGEFVPYLVLDDYILRETDEPFCRLGLLRSLDDGSLLDTPKIAFATSGGRQYESIVAKIMSYEREKPV